MHFITNSYKRFSKTNSTDPRQHVTSQIWGTESPSTVPVVGDFFSKRDQLLTLFGTKLISLGPNKENYKK